MRKAELMARAKALGVQTRKQCRRHDGTTTTTWRSAADVARECQEAWHMQHSGGDAPGSASAVPLADTGSCTQASAEQPTSEEPVTQQSPGSLLHGHTMSENQASRTCPKRS